MNAISADFSMSGPDARVKIGPRQFLVTTSNRAGKESTCPSELIISALGS